MAATLEQIVAWAKRRGFVFQTSEIYGGLANNYDYGPYGVQLKNNIRDMWWKRFVLSRPDIVGLDGAILMQREVWEAAGHAENFNELLVDDKVNHKRYRADHLIEDWAEKKNNDVNVEKLSMEEMTAFIQENSILSPDGNPVSDVRKFSGMFSTNVGAVSGSEDKVYLRPETAQSIFVNFKNVTDTMRVKIPFGIAQVGKAFRNEITKGQFIFRTIELEQMEIEYFVTPDADWETIMDDWLAVMKEFYYDLGAPEEKIRIRQHENEELSHYSKRTYDPEYEFDFGWREIAGLAYRTDFDLNTHKEVSGKKLEYRDPITNEVYIPHVIEPTFGIARAMLVAIYSAYTEEELESGSRIVMKFPPEVAPVKVAVFPLQKDDQLREVAQGIFSDLSSKVAAEYDDSGNIGKMYRRQDEIGTPYCVTVDFQTLEDQTVTVRDRDSMEQERVAIDDLQSYITTKVL